MRTILQKLSITVLLLFISSSVVFTQWMDDPVIKTKLLSMVNFQNFTNVLYDESGGGIVTWAPLRQKGNQYDFDIYAQRYNVKGIKLWDADSIPIAKYGNFQWNEKIVSDGLGGAIIAWEDRRRDKASSPRSDIYAQRIDSTGNIKWAINGIPVCSFRSVKTYPVSISDGVGGAVIFWTDNRRGTLNGDIFAQRINSSGEILWEKDGLLIQQAVELRGTLKVLKGNEGEIILVWNDQRNKISSIDNPDLYAQKINLSGQVLWNPDGIPICTAIGIQFASTVSDGFGGLISTWDDNRSNPQSGIPLQVYTQRIDNSGNILWAANGALICGGNNIKSGATALNDGLGGAFIVWGDRRNDHTPYRQDIFAQRINSSGVVQWITNGIPICRAIGFQTPRDIFSDNTGGAVITWNDSRLGSTASTEIFVQRVNSAGAIQWEENGIQLTNNFFAEITYPTDGEVWVAGSHPKISWQAKGIEIYIDLELSTDAGVTWTLIGDDIYAINTYTGLTVPNFPSNECKVRIVDRYTHLALATSKGLFTIKEPSINITYPIGNETWIVGSSPKITWALPGPNKYINIDLSVDSGKTWIPIAKNILNVLKYKMIKVPNFPSTKCKLRITDTNGNPLILSYGLFTIETPVIQITSPSGGEVWKVGGDAVMRWKSNCGSKLVNIDLSTDGGTGWIHLKKNLPDDGDWRISVIPNLPSTKCKIRISDIYGYASAVSNGYFTITKSIKKLSADNSDNTEAVQLPTEFALDQNYPNPFNPATVISYQLPVFSHATLKVYDVLGNEVVTLVNEEKAPGFYQVKFDAGNLSTGVYIYRLNAGSFTSTKKLLLMK